MRLGATTIDFDFQITGGVVFCFNAFPAGLDGMIVRRAAWLDRAVRDREQARLLARRRSRITKAWLRSAGHHARKAKAIAGLARRARQCRISPG